MIDAGGLRVAPTGTDSSQNTQSEPSNPSRSVNPSTSSEAEFQSAPRIGTWSVGFIMISTLFLLAGLEYILYYHVRARAHNSAFNQRTMSWRFLAESAT